MPEDKLELVRHSAQVSRVDPERFFAFCADDIEWDMSRLMPDGRIYRGHDGVREYWTSWTGTWQDFGFDFGRTAEIGDDVVVEVHNVGRGRGSGAAVDLRFGALFTVHDGKITRFRAYPDFDAALAAAGG